MKILKFSAIFSLIILFFFFTAGVVNRFNIQSQNIIGYIDIMFIPMLMLIWLPVFLAIRYYGKNPIKAKQTFVISAVTLALLFKMAL